MQLETRGEVTNRSKVVTNEVVMNMLNHSFISSSYSPVHLFLPLPMNAVATLHLVVLKPLLLFLAHYLLFFLEKLKAALDPTWMTSEVQYRRLFLFSVTAIDQKGGYQQKQNYQRGGYRNQNQSSY